MKYRTRIYYSEAQKREMWDRWSRGESLKSIGRFFERGSSSIYNVLSRNGGIRPPTRKRSGLALSLLEREEISRGLARDASLRMIAVQLGRSPSTISREIKRNGGLHQYRASDADAAAWERAHRSKACKLAGNRFLQQTVTRNLTLHWSPNKLPVG